MVQQLQLGLSHEVMPVRDSPEAQKDVIKTILDGLPTQVIGIAEHYDEICQSSALSNEQLLALFASTPEPERFVSDLLANFVASATGGYFDPSKAEAYKLIEKLKHEAGLKADADSVVQRATGILTSGIKDKLSLGPHRLGEHLYFLELDPSNNGNRNFYRVGVEGNNATLFDESAKLDTNLSEYFVKASVADVIMLVNDLRLATQLPTEAPNL